MIASVRDGTLGLLIASIKEANIWTSIWSGWPSVDRSRRSEGLYCVMAVIQKVRVEIDRIT